MELLNTTIIILLNKFIIVYQDGTRDIMPYYRAKFNPQTSVFEVHSADGKKYFGKQDKNRIVDKTDISDLLRTITAEDDDEMNIANAFKSSYDGLPKIF
jgi:hypothetical protein